MASNMNSVFMPPTNVRLNSITTRRESPVTLQIHRRLHPEHGNTQQEVAQRTAAYGCDKAYYICTEPVETFGSGKPYTAYGQRQSCQAPR